MLREEDLTNLQILHVVGQTGGTRTKEICQKVHLSRSAVLKRTQELEGRGLLIKKLEPLAATGIRPAYFFRLASEVSVSLVEDSLLEKTEQLSGMTAQPMRPEPKQTFSRKPRKPSTTEILIDRLPEFDPGWSAEVQAKWFDSYQRLTSLASMPESPLQKTPAAARLPAQQ